MTKSQIADSVFSSSFRAPARASCQELAFRPFERETGENRSRESAGVDIDAVGAHFGFGDRSMAVDNDLAEGALEAREAVADPIRSSARWFSANVHGALSFSFEMLAILVAVQFILRRPAHVDC